MLQLQGLLYFCCINGRLPVDLKNRREPFKKTPMYALFYHLSDDYLETRTAFRPAHFEHVKTAKSRGELLLGGAFDKEKEALLVFDVEDKNIVKAFAESDPYVRNGVVLSWHIHKWNEVVSGV
ncbi:MAG: YciI family protein [Chitinophagales bacterium]